MELLKRLCETPGVSGFERPVQALVAQELEAVCDRVWRDRIGNVIGLKRATTGTITPQKVVFAAHVDEIGLLVTAVDDAGFVRFTPIGGFDPANLLGRPVVIQGREAVNGVIAPNMARGRDNGDGKQAPQMSDLYIDVALPPETAARLIQVGDVIHLDEPFRHLHADVVTARNFDDRLGVYCMLEAMKAIRETDVELYAVSTVQEELGVRGAPMAIYEIEPDMGLAIDGSLAGDIPPTAAHEKRCRLGQGTGIYIMDKLTVGSPRLVRFLIGLCQREGIAFQRNVGGGTDASAIQRTKGGALATTIGPPIRYMHSSVQLAHVADIQATSALLRAFAEHAHELDPDDWNQAEEK